MFYACSREKKVRRAKGLPAFAANKFAAAEGNEYRDVAIHDRPFSNCEVQPPATEVVKNKKMSATDERESGGSKE